MTAFSLRLLGIIALFLAGAGPAHSQPPQNSRTDRHGAALPDGAIARLGTLRLTHLGGISAVAISPDGTVAASGVRDGKETYLGERVLHQANGFTLGEGVRVTEATIRLWNVKTGELLRQLSTPDAPVSHLRFAADGKTLFAGCGKFLCCWDTATGKKVWQQEAIVDARFHDGVHVQEVIQAGDTLASLHRGTIICPVEKDGGASFHYHPQLVVRFWNAKTGATLPTVKPLQSTISAEARVPILLHQVALTPDLKHAAIAVSEGDPLPRDPERRSFRDDQWKYPKSRAEVIDLATGKLVMAIANPDGEFGKLAISPDGAHVAALTGKTIETPFEEEGRSGVRIDNRKELWWASVDTKKKQVLAQKLDSVQNLAFVGQDRLAAQDSELRIRPVESKVTVWRLDTGDRIEKHDVRPEIFAAACAAGVAVETWQNTVRLIDIKSGKPLQAFEGHRLAPSLRFAIHSSDTLISRDADAAIFWDARTWQPARSMPMPKDGDRRAWWWNCDTEFDHGICVEKGLYLHKGKRDLELRDIKRSKTVRRIDGKGEHFDGNFSPAGNRLVCDEDGSYGFFEVATGKRLSTTPGDPKNVGYMWYRHPEFSTHGKYFARPGTDERPAIELYDVETGKLLRKLKPRFADRAAPGVGGSILKFKFSPDERLVFGEVHEAGGVDNGFSSERVSISIWSADTGELLQDLVVQPALHVFWREMLSRSEVGVMAISHDRRFVALARTSGRSWQRGFESTPIEIWEVASGEKRGEQKGHGPIADLAFSPDDRCLASSSDDSTILIWDLGRPLQPLKRGAGLTEQELDECWRILFVRNAAKADSAIWKLVDCPDDCLPYLQKKLRPVPVSDAGRVRNLFADLDSEDFEIRTRASAELARFGELILPRIEQAIKDTGSLEARKRLESLAETARAASRPYGTTTRIGEWRALEILERIGRPRALKILSDLANGCPDAQLTIAAKAALQRVKIRTRSGR